MKLLQYCYDAFKNICNTDKNVILLDKKPKRFKKRNNANRNKQELDDDIMLTRAEAAKFLNVSVGTLAIWKCTKRYDLASYKRGRNVCYKISDLRAFQKQLRTIEKEFYNNN